MMDVESTKRNSGSPEESTLTSSRDYQDKGNRHSLLSAWSHAGSQIRCWCCQSMVIGGNSAPTGIPNLGCGAKENFIQWEQLNCEIALLQKQHDCGTAQLWSRTAEKQHCCKVDLRLVFPLHFCKTALVLAKEAQPSVIDGKGKYNHQRACMGANIHIEKSLPLVPDWSVFMQIRTPKPHSLIDPKNTVLIG